MGTRRRMEALEDGVHPLPPLTVLGHAVHAVRTPSLRAQGGNAIRPRHGEHRTH